MPAGSGACTSQAPASGEAPGDAPLPNRTRPIGAAGYESDSGSELSNHERPVDASVDAELLDLRIRRGVVRDRVGSEGSGFRDQYADPSGKAWRGEENRSDVLVLDAETLDREPLAIVNLPHRVPAGFHGNWRPAT